MKYIVKALKKVIAENSEYEFYKKPIYKLYTDGSEKMLLVAIYGERNESIPLKVYQWYSSFNGYMIGSSIDPNLSQNYDIDREKGWDEVDYSKLKSDELKYFKNALNLVNKTINATIKSWNK